MPPAKRASTRRSPATKRAAKKTTGRSAAKKTTTRRTAAKKAPAKKTAKRSGPRKMSAAHKKALAQGREASGVVDRYLAALHTPKRRGRKVSEEALRQRLAASEARAKSATGVARLTAAQEARDLRARLAKTATTGEQDIKKLEADFVKVAKDFSERRSVGYGAWRDAGVPAPVLKRSGIARTRGR